MPIYKFYCGECEEEYEDYRALNESEETGECVICGSTDIERGVPVEVECDGGCGQGVDDDCGCGCC